MEPGYLEIWPGPVISMFLGHLTPGELAELKLDGIKGKRRLCEVGFYLGQYMMLGGRRDKAADYFRDTVNTSVFDLIEHAGARAELKRM